MVARLLSYKHDKHRPRCAALILYIVLGLLPPLVGGDVAVTVDGTTTNDSLVILLFDSAEGFRNFREPLRRMTVPAAQAASVVLRDLPPGDYAIVVYNDLNRNNTLDRNFIGIPSEPIGLSNGYQPKGPPTFSRAQFQVAEGMTSTQMLRLRRPLGPRGSVGVGVGMILRSNPYHGAKRNVLQVIPALTYVGERIQILGPQASVGIVGRDRIRLAFQARYRAGVYEEDDSPALTGLGDRSNTIMAGPALQSEFPGGIDLSLSYRWDLLNEIGGEAAQLAVSRSFPWRNVTFTPSAGLNWTDSELTNHDFGVPPQRAQPGRPAYAPGDALGIETSIGVFVELTPRCQFFMNGGIELLDRDVRDSPIVDKRYVITTISVLSYLF